MSVLPVIQEGLSPSFFVAKEKPDVFLDRAPKPVDLLVVWDFCF